MRDLDLIIFSKDRPAQLELLLRSLRRFLAPGISIRCRVLYTAGTEEMATGYDMVKQLYEDFTELIFEQDFRSDLLTMLDGTKRFTMFLVDDDVMISPFSMDSAEVTSYVGDPDTACLSLRMHPGVTICYTQGKQTPPPPGASDLRWRWQGQLGDWGYPMSLDGHLFRSKDIIPIIRICTFRNPNELENALAARPLSASWMTCFARPTIVNIPANRVQHQALNRHMGMDINKINTAFLSDQRLNLDHIIAKHDGASVHQEMELIFTDADAESKISRKLKNNTKIIFYSNNNQDRFFFSSIFMGKKNGTFVDIGSHDGILDNNTVFFERHCNWTGICIEANPKIIPYLSRNRTCICIHAFATSRREIVEFTILPSDIEPHSGATSSFLREELASIHDHIQIRGETMEMCSVQGEMASTICRVHGISFVDLCAIETNGTEIDVIHGLDLRNMIVDYILIDNRHRKIELYHAITENGYAKIGNLGKDEVYQRIPTRTVNSSHTGTTV